MNTSAAPLPSRNLMVRLSGMMFLQYAIWGAWLPFLWSFLSVHRGMSGTEIGDMFAIGAVGAIVGPFIAGQIADRYFSTEKFLAASHFVGALLIWQLATIESYNGFLLFSGLYGLVYAPTLSLTNSLAFHHLPDRDRDFGRVRLWGTFGWIVVGLLMGHWLAQVHAADPIAGKADAFRLSGVLGLGMAVFCLFLPRTPPSKGEQRSATFAAMGAVRRNPLATLFLLAIPVSCIHQFYFVHTEAFLGEKQASAPAFFQTIFGLGGGGLMTIGQMTELLVIGAIPLVAKTVSRKHLLALGLVAYALRMALFAYVDALPLPTMATLVIGIGLHGVCFGCFIFVAFMVVDEESGADIRASAQSLFNLVIIGCGVIVGSKIAGWVSDWTMVDGVQDYQRLFSVPMWGALACVVALVVFYPSRRSAED
jgi:nucleoside transporter